MTTTKSYKRYYRLHGPHFTKALCEYACSLMEDQNGPIKPFTKEEIENKLEQTGIKIQYNKLYDMVFVANMCKADFLGKSVQNDDKHLCQYIKDVIDDPDGYDGQPFIRWIADMQAMGIDIDWSEFV